MNSESLQQTPEQTSENRLKKLGFGVLGALGTLYGANFAVGAVLLPFYPVVGTAMLGAGAGLLYGGYRAFKHAAELEAGTEHDTTREARVSKLSRYAGGAALLVAGVTAANMAPLASGIALGVGIWCAGIAVAGWGISRIRSSFEVQPVATESTQTSYLAPSPVQ